jgi:hypothetical protein
VGGAKSVGSRTLLLSEDAVSDGTDCTIAIGASMVGYRLLSLSKYVSLLTPSTHSQLKFLALDIPAPALIVSD